MLLNELANLVLADAARLGDAWEPGNTHASGVMSGSRPEPEVVTMSMGTGLPGFCAASLSMSPWMRCDELRVGLRKIRAAGRGGVVAVARGRGAGMEVLSEVKLCASSSEPMTWPSLQDQAAGGLMRKEHSGDAGDQQRIAQAEQHRGDERETNRCPPNGMHDSPACLSGTAAANWQTVDVPNA